MIDVAHYAAQLADEHDVDYELVEFIIHHESSWNPYSIGDLDINCTRTDRPVYARGILQITECYWPDITNVQAFDPYWALQWDIPKMADKETCKRLWTACRCYFE